MSKNYPGLEILETTFEERVSKLRSNVSLRRLVIAFQGGEYCEFCGQGPVWNGEPLTLQIDHRDGNNKNNELSNLRLLCPNCHTQTETYAGRHMKGKKLSPEVRAKIAESNRGKKRSGLAKANYSIAAQSRTPEHYQKMIATKKKKGISLNGR